MYKKYTELLGECIGCGRCTAHYKFLQKYGFIHGLKDLNRLKELSFHCFMCGECTRHCPKEVDGKAIMQAIRIGRAERNGGMPMLYVYCASCAGNLSRKGCQNVRHIIPEILGFLKEEEDIYNNGKNRKAAQYW